MGRSDKLTWQLTVLIYISRWCKINRFVINWQAGAKLIRHVRQYIGFVTLNASAIAKRHDVFKRELGARLCCGLIG